MLPAPPRACVDSGIPAVGVRGGRDSGAGSLRERHQAASSRRSWCLLWLELAALEVTGALRDAPVTGQRAPSKHAVAAAPRRHCITGRSLGVDRMNRRTIA